MSSDGIARDGIRRGELVVVTGGGGGFGRAFARRFLAATLLASIGCATVPRHGKVIVARRMGPETGRPTFAL